MMTRRLSLPFVAGALMGIAFVGGCRLPGGGRGAARAPAEKAGLKPGDLITHVDGKATKGMDVDAVVAMIRGQEGTQVRITVHRKGVAAPITVTITRQKVDYPNVTSHMEGDFGYISLM